MFDFFVEAITNLNNTVGNLGVTIILIGVVSRILFYPFTKTSIKQSQKMREMKPKLDELKKRHGKDKKKLAEEQARLYKESGVSALGCLAPIVQLVVAVILFQVLLRLLNTGVDTNFLIWDLAQPDTYELENLPFKIPGGLVIINRIFPAESLATNPEAAGPGLPRAPPSVKTCSVSVCGFLLVLSTMLGFFYYHFPRWLLTY